MERLTSLIYNFNTNCHKQYTNVSKQLGNKLDEVLKKIERFYYSDFWVSRFKRRLSEEHIDYIPIELATIQGLCSELRENTKFKLFDEESILNGRSNSNTMIALNVNLDENELNDSHINNIIMHEFGHRQYNNKEFNLVIDLNKKIINNAGLYIKNNQILSEIDYKYFTDHNELRLRIIPIVKEMRDNKWSIRETYDNSVNLQIDDIKDIFTREYILKLIDNIL